MKPVHLVKGAKRMWAEEPIRLLVSLAVVAWLALEQLPDDQLVSWSSALVVVGGAIKAYLLRNGFRIPTWLGGVGFPTEEDGTPAAPDTKGGVWSPESVKSMFYVEGHPQVPPPPTQHRA